MSEARDKTVKYGSLVVVFILTVYAAMDAMGPLTPSINSFANLFSSVPLTSVMLIVSVTQLVSIPFQFALGFFINKMGLKRTLYLGLLIFVIAGALPYVFGDHFGAVLATRAVFGIGFGILYPMGPILVSRFMEESKRPKFMGWGISFANMLGLVYTFLGGIVAAVDVRYIWFFHLVMIIPLLLMLFMPKSLLNNDEKARDLEKEAVTQARENGAKVREPLSAMAIFFIVVCLLSHLAMWQNWLYISVLVEQSGLGTPATSGVVMGMVTLGGAISGLVYGKYIKLFRRRVFAFAAALLVIDNLLLTIAGSVPVCMIGAFCGGFGWVCCLSSVMTGTSTYTTGKQNATAMGIMSAMVAVSSFIAPYVPTFIGKVTGQEDNLHIPFIFAMSFWLAFMIFILIKPISVDKKE